MNLQELRARRAALLLPYCAALEVEKRHRPESLPEDVRDLLAVVTESYQAASAALREARRAAAPSGVSSPPPRSG